MPDLPEQDIAPAVYEEAKPIAPEFGLIMTTKPGSAQKRGYVKYIS